MNAIIQNFTLQRLTIFVGLYLLFSFLAISLSNIPGQVTLFWPASGIALTFLIRYGLTWAIPLCLTILLMHALFNPVPPIFLFFSVASNVTAACLAALYIRKFKLSNYLSIHSGLILLRAGILMAVTTALLGVFGLCISGISNFSDYWPSVAKWSMGDLLGIISTGPAMLLMTAPKSKNPDIPLDSDYAPLKSKLFWTVLMAFSFMLIFIGSAGKSPYAIGLTGLPIALLVWSAIRFQPIWSAIGILFMVVAITLMAGYGMAGFKQPHTLIDVVFLLCFMCMIAVFPLVLMASNFESRISIRNIIRRATTDLETGLPNRTAFEETSRQLLDGLGPNRTLAYLDFDHFKLINDTASHQAGDEMIKGIASMVSANLYPSDKIFRLGGDEFALLFLCEGREAELRANRVLHTIETFKIGWNNQILSTTASIGLATLKPRKSDFAQILSQADAACFTAKELGGNRVCLSDQGSIAIQTQTEAMQFAILIRKALSQNHFELLCQDILTLNEQGKSGRYFEVLLRLRDQNTGDLLSPNSFIPAAERFNLGIKIDYHVIEQVLSWMEANPHHAETVRACSINLSGASMGDEQFSNFLHQRIQNSSFPANKIIFEITETCAMQDLAKAQLLISNLREIGCRFALDDFGAGFCSFNYLQNLDVDIFKIDGSFIRDLESSEFSRAVIRSITDIAHVLNKTTTAEHCESSEIIDLLRQLGVDQAQGYAIHKPEPISEYFKV
ncbi:MAG TPA: EAL domain-containing protein [Arenimonas sp.]|nr:EAL domain-containing protein [Arenimonas sp.]